LRPSVPSQADLVHAAPPDSYSFLKHIIYGKIKTHCRRSMDLFRLTAERAQAKCLPLKAIVRLDIIDIKWNWLRYPIAGTDILSLFVSTRQETGYSFYCFS
jgi:hypothetical protein